MYTLTTNRPLRIVTLCILYFAQGFPWGFMTTALISFLASKGLTMVQSGQLTAMAYLPWTFKLFWGPLIDSFTFIKMGRRRPWILFAQLGMIITLIMMSTMGDISENIILLGWMFFFHNCFASLQDVSCDALAVDILLPEEQGKVNGAMWGAKVIGTGLGAGVMGTLLVFKGLTFTFLLQSIVMILVALFPLLIVEKPNEVKFPWSKSDKIKKITKNGLINPLKVIKTLIMAFSKKPSFYGGVFILTAAINQGLNSGVLPVYYNKTFGWESDFYSQIVGGPGMILEFLAALLGGFLADKYGRRKIFFLGWGGFSVLSGILGIMIITHENVPYWFQMGYLIISPSLIAIGTVSMFALTMALSWSTASATMFTSYMAISNLSVVIGTNLIGPLTAIFNVGQLYIFMMLIGLLPGVFLKKMDPRPILRLKKNN